MRRGVRVFAYRPIKTNDDTKAASAGEEQDGVGAKARVWAVRLMLSLFETALPDRARAAARRGGPGRDRRAFTALLAAAGCTVARGSCDRISVDVGEDTVEGPERQGVPQRPSGRCVGGQASPAPHHDRRRKSHPRQPRPWIHDPQCPPTAATPPEAPATALPPDVGFVRLWREDWPAQQPHVLPASGEGAPLRVRTTLSRPAR